MLHGAFLNPQSGDDERDLFARHTVLVAVARAVAETLRPPEQQATQPAMLYDRLTEGFGAWMRDAAGDDGAAALANLVDEVNRYDWQAAQRDTLKNLYHAAIPQEIRHDFGEYYTPDWLARAVCEEVMDADWRREVIELAVAGQQQGPAVLDPSCGSGNLLVSCHATSDGRTPPCTRNWPPAPKPKWKSSTIWSPALICIPWPSSFPKPQKF